MKRQPYPTQSPSYPNKFPQDIQCIIRHKEQDYGSLYISNIEAAQNQQTLRRYKIGAVMSCAKGYELKHSVQVVPHYKYIPTIDHQQCDISIHFDDAVNFITEKLKKTNVLVHCVAGVSRSVSMVLAYFIREHNMLYEQAYSLVKSKRKIINPNDGFIQQLKHYSSKNKGNTQKSRYSGHVSPFKNYDRSETYKSNNYQYQTHVSPHRHYDRSNTYNTNNYDFPIQRSHTDFRTNSNRHLRTMGNEQTEINAEKTQFFSPNSNQKSKLANSYKGYQDISKSVNGKLKLSGSNKINAELSPNKYNDSTYIKRSFSPNTNRVSYFQSLNDELNQKLNKIKQKYQFQRLRLQQKYESIEERRKTNEYAYQPRNYNIQRQEPTQNYRPNTSPLRRNINSSRLGQTYLY